VEVASVDAVGVVVAVAEEGCRLADWCRISHKMLLQYPDHTADAPLWLTHLCRRHALSFLTSKTQAAC